MPRLLGIDIPPNKRIDIALRSIYGVGPAVSAAVVEKAGVDPAVRAKDLDEEQQTKIVQALQDVEIRGEKMMLEGDLRRELQTNIKRLKGIKSYRGLRHMRGLPARGQRTQTNARTRKGPKKTVGVQRNPNAKKGIH
ncbi:MAG: 30S ribosomal protein S13 [Verrucomicrobiales bacterium]|jgi:small subunit ribosomal protein S13|nr:30S ribosomal protein S13 [Verrucomicrobiales bacterium]|tara:strand:- start:107 stop:517 length:411 start_codon:yes stop_codon:yes gene_type:complete